MSYSSSSSDGESFSENHCEKVEECTHDGSSHQHCLSTNTSSPAGSPNLADKPMVVSKHETAHSEAESEEYDIMAAQRDSNVFGSAAENDKKLAQFFDIANYRLEYANLNDCVTSLLKKAKDSDAASRDIKRR